MADDIVITEFGADLSKFNTEVDKAAKSIDNLDSEMKDAAKTGKDLSGNMGDAGKKVDVLAASSTKATKDVSALGKSTSLSTEATKGFKEGLDSVNPMFSKIASGAKTLGTSIYAALGPIGLIVGAIVLAFAGLVKIFAGTQEGADKVAKVTAVVGSVFDRVLGVAQVMGKAIFDAFSNPKEAAEKLWEAIKTNIVNRITGIADQFKFLGEIIEGVFAMDTDRIKEGINGFGEATTRALTGVRDLAGKAGKAFDEFGKEISKAADTGARIAEIDKRLRAVALDKAKNEGRITRELEEQRAIVSNTTKSQAERAAAAEEFRRLNKELTGFETKRLDLEIERGKLAASTSDTLDEEKIRLAGLVSQKEEANARELASNREINNQINALNKAASDKAIAESKRVLAEQQKDAEKRVADINAANAKIENIKAAPKEEARRAKLTPDEIKVDDLNKQYQKQLDDAKAAFEQLRKLKEGDAEAIAQIDKEMADNALAIEANKNAALAKLDEERLAKVKEENDAKLKLIHEATTDEQTLEEEAVNKKFDDLESAAKDVITNEEDLTAALVELEMQRQEQLAQISADAAKKRVDEQVQNAQDVLDAASNLGDGLVAIDKAQTDSKIAALDAQIEAQKKYGQDTTALEAKREEEQKKAARRAYAIQKAFALAQLAIDTAKAISSLTASSAENPLNGVTFGAAGAAQFAAGLIQILANIAQATALLSSKAPGLYKGDPYVSGKADRPGRDGHLRWLDEGERVVTKKDNVEHWDLFEAVRLGKLDQWKAANTNPIALNFERIAKVPDTTGLMAYNFAPMVNNYVEGNSTLLTLPKGHDKGIIRASKESTREQRRTNDILEAMASRKTSTPSKRLW